MRDMRNGMVASGFPVSATTMMTMTMTTARSNPVLHHHTTPLTSTGTGTMQRLLLLTSLLLLVLPPAVLGFFIQPSPLHTQNALVVSTRQRSTRMAAQLKAGDRVCVIGSTGGCGQLIAARLADAGKYKVRAIGRGESKLRDVLGSESNLEFGVADSRNIDSLYGPLSDADCVIIATGTSAFPSPRWKGGNTPDAVDRKGVQNILRALTSKPRKRPIKKVVFLSSVGVLRTKSMPYSILNLFGVLDAKRDSEELLKQMAATEDFDYVIVSGKGCVLVWVARRKGGEEG